MKTTVIITLILIAITIINLTIAAIYFAKAKKPLHPLVTRKDTFDRDEG